MEEHWYCSAVETLTSCRALRHNTELTLVRGDGRSAVEYNFETVLNALALAAGKGQGRGQ